MNEFINKLKILKDEITCLIFGHDPYEYRWYTEWSYTMSHKGGKKRCHKRKIIRHRHCRVECLRCGKILKKK